jgi:hypothetical protein
MWYHAGAFLERSTLPWTKGAVKNMARYLDPKTDLIFKRVFGERREPLEFSSAASCGRGDYQCRVHVVEIVFKTEMAPK